MPHAFRNLFLYIICHLAVLILQLSNSTFFGRSSGTLRRPAVSGSRETFTLANDSEPTRSRTPEASPATVNKISSGQRTSPLGGSLDPKHTSSGRNNSSIKNYDSAIKGIESLHFDDEERFHWMHILSTSCKSSNLCDRREGRLTVLIILSAEDVNSNSRNQLLAFVVMTIDNW